MGFAAFFLQTNPASVEPVIQDRLPDFKGSGHEPDSVASV